MLIVGFLVDIFKTGEIFLSVMPTALLSILMWVALMIVSQVLSKESAREDYKQNIYSLSNQTSVKGSFVLGSGNINSVEKYYTFIRNSNGGYERFIIDTGNVILYQDIEGDNIPYYFAQQITYSPPEWLTPKGWFTTKKMTTYDFHVPVNTIIDKFEVR